ncbi:hypothetical protein [Streptantibioticus silvisoli]|uniref:Uncharacterized protein n=1 Tax=Streptantibioticus silvisoli TaxID=2705255 RepID=A0ABT6VU27_9ACTN|nr:hypothetical protein [Streptantibioticus silvisoli]MDI5961262.1 hypothetical protein [Streptantibioticus silvisoli]
MGPTADPPAEGTDVGSGERRAVDAAITAPAPAVAVPEVNISCQSSGPMHFSPGVQVASLAQHITYDGQRGMCNDNSGERITSARPTAAPEQRCAAVSSALS